ncbi:MAG TPA: anti-sigma F factor [Symbiobacteriaceae bacterium]|jgi:stage II sporulation protein AB (anti-sigma F factor)
MVQRNRVLVELAAIPENVGVARLLAAMVAAQGDFTVAEVDEVKLAVSEAVTNAVVHGYQPDSAQDHSVRMEVSLRENVLEIIVSDAGRGIENVQLAMQPAVSSDPDRMGLGFSFMESHMDSLEVDSAPGRGTRVRMTKRAGTAHLSRLEAN